MGCWLAWEMQHLQPPEIFLKYIYFYKIFHFYYLFRKLKFPSNKRNFVIMWLGVKIPKSSLKPTNNHYYSKFITVKNLKTFKSNYFQDISFLLLPLQKPFDAVWYFWLCKHFSHDDSYLQLSLITHFYFVKVQIMFITYVFQALQFNAHPHLYGYKHVCEL